MAKEFCVLSEFESPKLLYKAAKEVASQGYTKFDTYSPFPIHGMDSAMKLKSSKLGWIVLMGGAFGLVGGMLLQWWVSAVEYRLVISGKPFFSYPAFIPVTFELMVLFSAFAAVFGMFIINGLPQHYHPLFNSENFRKVTSHGFFLAIETSDPNFNKKDVMQLMESLQGRNIEVIKE